ncbi:MAG TPA: glycosyltransferase [Thermoplasmatales archaeon]|nr:glycosyltransferase [Thermoplasmatales archaeon]HEX08193.1 glycosyltransferase [Thermoplasmatales archaeon]
MNWTSNISLEQNVLKKCEKVKPVDVMVGVLCKNVEGTVLNVLNTINEGLNRYFPEYKKAIVVSKGKSTDRTDEIVDLFYPYIGINKIVTHDITEGGKGAGIYTIIDIAHHLNAKAILLIDGDILSVKPEWIQILLYPILYGRADLTIPYYIRDKYDGLITNLLVYPFTRALYEIDIRQPIAGEFGISKPLYEILRRHPLFPKDFGVDIFITTTAAAEGMALRETLFAQKIHESTTRYLEHEKLLAPMFRQVSMSMFELTKHYRDRWMPKKREKKRLIYRGCFGQTPIPVKIDVDKLRSSFRKEFEERRNIIAKAIGKEKIRKLEKIAEKHEEFDAEFWAEIVYSFAAYYKKVKNEKEKLVDSLKSLWLGRVVSYALETRYMDVNEAETVIQKQAEIFEDKINYFLSIY